MAKAPKRFVSQNVSDRGAVKYAYVGHGAYLLEGEDSRDIAHRVRVQAFFYGGDYLFDHTARSSSVELDLCE